MADDFNNDLFIDFMTAQCKTLSFIAFLVRVFTVREIFTRTSNENK